MLFNSLYLKYILVDKFFTHYDSQNIGSSLALCIFFILSYRDHLILWNIDKKTSRPLRLEFAGALYHVTSRGNEKKPVYLDDAAM